MSTSASATLRKDLRQYLTSLESTERECLTQAAMENFLTTPEYRRCRHIAAFYPIRHELDLMPLIETCWADNKQVYLPCLLPRPFQKMIFQPFTAKTPLRLNRFRIPEPDLPVRRHVNVRQLDIVITPLLAFGPQGQRLGMGGGFYDRTFAFLKRHTRYQKPHLWAIALEAQAQALTANPWDVNIDGVTTEKTIYRYD